MYSSSVRSEPEMEHSRMALVLRLFGWTVFMTGAGIMLVGYTVVDDIGNVLNPLLAEGQVHGGLAQGIGQALLEACVYDGDSGQLLSGSFMDYCMPHERTAASP